MPPRVMVIIPLSFVIHSFNMTVGVTNMVRITSSVFTAIPSLGVISCSMRYFGSFLSSSPVIVSTPEGISCWNVSITSFDSILIPSRTTVFSPNGICLGDMSIRVRDSDGRWHLFGPFEMSSSQGVLAKLNQGTVACVLLNEYTSNVMKIRVYNPRCFIPRLHQWNYLVLSLDSSRGENIYIMGVAGCYALNISPVCGQMLHPGRYLGHLPWVVAVTHD